jgi:hypothetical protein
MAEPRRLEMAKPGEARELEIHNHRLGLWISGSRKGAPRDDAEMRLGVRTKTLASRLTLEMLKVQ